MFCMLLYLYILLCKFKHASMTGNISAVTFTLKNVNDTRVHVNITDPLSGIHLRGKQLTIRDILKKDLKYRISYHKSGSTGKVTCSTSITTATFNMLGLSPECLASLFFHFCLFFGLSSQALSSLPSSPKIFIFYSYWTLA